MNSHILNLRNISLALVLLLALLFVTAAPTLASGAQGGGRFCAGDNLTISSGQTLDRLLAFGCNVTIEPDATVTGDIANFGGNISVAGTVNGNISLIGGNLTLSDTAVVSGNVRAVGGNIQRAPGAQVGGSITNGNRGNRPVTPPVPPIAPLAPLPFPFMRGFDYRLDLLGGLISALAFAALGALVVIFAPNATKRVSQAAQSKPLNTAGVGCLTLILLPILALLLIITILGIPVALILGLVSAAAWIFGGIAVGLLAGEKILEAFKARDILPVVAVILGVVVLFAIGQIPILGWLISLAVGLIGLGAVVLTRFGTRAYPLPPTMMLTPAASTAGAPGTYTPSPADVAAWESKLRDTPTTDVPPPAPEPKTEPPSTEPPSNVPGSDVPPTDADR